MSAFVFPTLRRALAGLAAAVTLTLAASVSASMLDVAVVDRTEASALPVYGKDGRRWIVGTPGHEYTLRVRNTTGGRLLVIASVDGVNIVTGETASPAQSGYVLEPYATLEVNGWRKSLSRTAAFYFTDLPDAYATRTGRPDNLGVIGFAVFAERVLRTSHEPPRSATLPLAKDAASPAENAAGALARNDAQAAERDRPAAMPAPSPSLGTGHGRTEYSRVERVGFDRATREPAEMVTIHYDRRDNLIAMGVLPPPMLSRGADPFPGGARGFVADPPLR